MHKRIVGNNHFAAADNIGRLEIVVDNKIDNPKGEQRQVGPNAGLVLVVDYNLAVDLNQNAMTYHLPH